MKKRIHSGKIPKKEVDGDLAVKEIVGNIHEIMVAGDLNEITWQESAFKLKLKRQGIFSHETAALTTQGAGNSPGPGAKEQHPAEKAGTSKQILSPMDGVFYRASAPGEEPFVKENDDVPVGKTICIIEAMKLMNEVQVERHCKILKILPENGSAVKVGQPLFEVDNY